MTPNKSSRPPTHRADLAGSLAARSPFQRYIEIVYGALLGLIMWAMDAMMHARVAGGTREAGFIGEMLTPGLAQTLFRGAYIAVAVSFGWMLWRGNLKREAAERQRHERAVARERLRAMNAMVNTFMHEVNNPLAVITGYSQSLARRLQSESDREKLAQVMEAAFHISEVIEQLTGSEPLYIVDVAGVERIVPGGSPSGLG